MLEDDVDDASSTTLNAIISHAPSTTATQAVNIESVVSRSNMDSSQLQQQEQQQQQRQLQDQQHQSPSQSQVQSKSSSEHIKHIRSMQRRRTLPDGRVPSFHKKTPVLPGTPVFEGVYQGDLAGDIREGKGVLTWSNGDVYEGKDDRKEVSSYLALSVQYEPLAHSPLYCFE